jgi:hypothetical protein
MTTKAVDEMKTVASTPIMAVNPFFGPSFTFFYTASAFRNVYNRLKGHKRPLYCGFSEDSLNLTFDLLEKLQPIDDVAYR